MFGYPEVAISLSSRRRYARAYRFPSHWKEQIMKPKIESLIAVALVLVSALALRAQAPTSRQVPFNKLASTLAGCTPAPCTQPASVDVQLWDDPISTLPVNLILTEQHRGIS